jgi:hypothetical protein
MLIGSMLQLTRYPNSAARAKPSISLPILQLSSPKWADLKFCDCRISPTLKQGFLHMASVGIFMEERPKNASLQVCTLSGIQ